MRFHRLFITGVGVFALALTGACRNGGATTAAGPQRRPDAAKPASAAPRPLEKVTTPPGTFFAAPYLQLGTGGAKDGLSLVWLTRDEGGGEKAVWGVETRSSSSAGSGAWTPVSPAPTAARVVRVAGVAPHTVWSVPLQTGQAAGGLFDYRVLRNAAPVFAARAQNRKGAREPYRVALFGDSGDGTAAQKQIAHRASLAKPDLVFVTGDIVYAKGRASEYQTRFFPIYNADTASPAIGAPLLRSTLFASAPGNHDLAYSDIGSNPDGLAYYYYWFPPRNGPLLPTTASGAKKHAPRLRGPEASQAAFRDAAGDSYPQAANYSFDYGNAHWTVLDSNYYTDWTDPALLAWLEKDLAAARGATWRFVAFHVPPFSSARRHQEEQWMRVLCPVLEKHGVDMVFSGHVHNYQRTHPLRFAPVRGLNGEYRDPQGRVRGEFALDRDFDGAARTVPSGIIYVITGAGGASLYDRNQQDKPETMQSFTRAFVSTEHSFTVLDVNGSKLTLRQLSEKGKELDRFTVTK